MVGLMGLLASDLQAEVVDAVAWWPGDGNANDIVGTNDGVLLNGGTYATGMVGQAFSLDGVDDRVEVPGSVSLALGSSFTIEMWIQPDSMRNAVFLEKGTGDSDNRVGFAVSANGALCGYFDSGACSASSSPADVAAGIFSHVAFVFDNDANSARLYLNGELVATGEETRTPTGTVASLNIGMRTYNSDQFFDGLIDEPTVYARALSTSEILAIYDSGSTGKSGAQPAPSLSPPSIALLGALLAGIGVFGLAGRRLPLV
ncbi:MAG: LamG domain-containing protein [Deltaproteobacteria bacterium]|nr:LamG domain-containing protein [Deltaproteobacteria bacterium]